MKGVTMVFTAAGIFCFAAALEAPPAHLQVGFYADKCRDAESIVEEEVMNAVEANVGLGAGLLRMHFHDCFVRGCDGSVLIDSTASNLAEKDSPANNPSLRGFDVIDRAKSRLEATCKGVVSCADILAFAARDSVAALSGFYYTVPSGRRDGRTSLASEANTNLPPPLLTVPDLTQAFADKGLTQAEMVTLSGAHTIGRSHCNSFSNRLYSFNTTTLLDPSLDPKYAAQLKTQCPQDANASIVVPMNPAAPYDLDNSYYSNIMAKKALFTSDQALLSNPATASLVSQNARNGPLWLGRFAAAMVKMGQIGVLIGKAGEIRTNCRVIN